MPSQFDNWVNYHATRQPAAMPQHPLLNPTPQYYQGPVQAWPGGPSDVGMAPQGADGLLARGFQAPGMFSPNRLTDTAVVVRPIRYF